LKSSFRATQFWILFVSHIFFIYLMENEQNHDASGVTEQTPIRSRHSTDPNSVVKNSQNVAYIYRQDVVKSRISNKIGIVTEVAGDSDSDSSSDDDVDDDDDDEDYVEDECAENEESDINENGEEKEGDGEGGADSNIKNPPLPDDQVRVLWLDETETTQNLNDVIVVDRGFLHGDFVASSADPTGQVGIVVDVNISVDLFKTDKSFITNISSRDLKRVRDFTIGDYVVLGPWLGRLDDVLDNVTVMFDDGSVCKVLKADPTRLKSLGNKLEDGNFPFYPGQRVKASSSSIFKNARWLSGLWKANKLEGTVTRVSVGSVIVYWIASAGYGPDSSITPDQEQSPKKLKLLSCFTHANWQLSDWCLLPSLGLSSSAPLDEGLSKLGLDDPTKDELGEIGCVKEAHGKKVSAESSSKEPVHESWPLHRKKIRKVVVRRDIKKSRKKEENFERALLIVNTRTRVDVIWQDGRTDIGLESTHLIPIDSPGDHEFVAEQYVVEKTNDDNEDSDEVRRVGVVRSVNAKERTACVGWLKSVARAEDPKEFDKEEIVSVYELEGHPDYDYCYGDVVVRLSPVFLPLQEEDSSQKNGSEDSKQVDDHKTVEGESTDEIHKDFSDLSWVGNITGLRNGDIEVTWADGMVSLVGPQAIYVVGRDDEDDSVGGSDISDDAASWETLEDDEINKLENAEEGVELQNSEAEYNPSVGENDGRALSIPMAAIGFMTRLASGIFTKNRKNLDPSGSVSLAENGLLLPEGSSILPEGVNSEDSKIFNSLTSKKDVDEHADTESKNLLDAAEALCSLKPEDGNDNSFFKKFDITKDPYDHFYLDSTGQNISGRKWLKKVQRDWNILQNNLPDGIYVRVYEDRMDLVRSVIVGAYGTPYQDGLFFFDFHLPPQYPDDPPSAYYHSGGWRINPNLYEEGKVCLSLLNTWTGRGNEMWDPSSSSILQVLISLQGLVLNSRPYFNEAGYDKQVGTAEGEKNSLSYNENTFLLNCKTMMHLIRRPPKDFEALIKEHFKKQGYFILKACDAYMKGYLIGTLTKDASISDKSIANANSVGFKLMLAKIVPKLLAALNGVGADCAEFKHFEQQLQP
jgi:ubiquitin-conjugating enzyme E2 O